MDLFLFLLISNKLNLTVLTKDIYVKYLYSPINILFSLEKCYIHKNNEIIPLMNLGDKMIIKNFKNSREELDMKQKDIAKFFNVNFTTVSGWETGKDTMPMYRLIEYANHFNYSLDYLFGITKRNSNYSKINMNLQIIGKNLRILRKKNKFTQKELANKLNTSQSAYSRYENGISLIPTTFLFNLTKIYEPFSIDVLFNRKKI